MRQPFTGVESRSVFACAGKIFEEKKVSLNFGIILQHHSAGLERGKAEICKEGCT